MRENTFYEFLQNEQSIKSVHAINSRISRANRVEEVFGVNLDEVVRDDERMYNTLIEIKRKLIDKNGAIQNAVRKYYLMVNNKNFPNLVSYQTRRVVNK